MARVALRMEARRVIIQALAREYHNATWCVVDIADDLAQMLLDRWILWKYFRCVAALNHG